MIPILYAADETRFITNGIGRLSDCIRCIVTEERNGVYECEFDYPLTGIHFDDIQLGRIIGCTHDDRGDIQPFIIYQRSVPDLSGVVTFNAHHISYKLNEIVTMPFTAGSIAETLVKIKANSINANPFAFWTDRTTTGTYKCEVPKAIRPMLGGEEGSILDVYGAGDYEFDRFTVKLHAHRGVDSDVEIRYSKNMIDLQETINADSLYNAVVPYWADDDGHLVMLPEVMLVYSGMTPLVAYLTDHNLIIIRTEDDEPIEVAYSEIKVAPLDMSETFEEKPTVAQLRNAARTRFENSDAWLPDENLTVDFVQLWQTEEFKDYAAAQRVSLCDTVSVYYPQAGISKVKQRVIRVVYNVLLDRYDSIELGSLQNSLGQAIMKEVLKEVPTTSMMESAISYATNLIRGGLGGYVVMTPGPDGYPQEILIMDTPDTATAVNVWRFNQGGLGHSHNGYEGPFDDIALTQDGRINASMITTGTLNANVITAGILADASGKNYWNLDAGQFVTKEGTIAGFDLNSDGLRFDNSQRLLNFSSSNGLISTRRRQYSGQGVYYTSGVVINGERMSFVGKRNSSDLDDYDEVAAFEVAYGGGYSWLNLLNSVGNAFMSFQEYSDLVNCSSNFSVSGTKSRQVTTDNYSERLLYCYETPTPLFGDIGEAVIDSDGFAYVDIDDIFSETVAGRVEYQVFLQKEGEGDCWIAEKDPRWFVIQGTPNLKVAWELKAKQKDYEMIRLEQPDSGLEEYAPMSDDSSLLDSYITEQEALLYGNN